MDLSSLPSIPYGRTARRLRWEHLPPAWRSRIEKRLGAPVLSAATRDTGYAPGMASVLTLATGEEVFVKAANRIAQQSIASAYATEAGRQQAFGERLPSPPMRWHIDDDWVVLAFDAHPGRVPERPWYSDDLDAALELTCAIAAVPVEDLDLPPLHADLPMMATAWWRLGLIYPDWPHLKQVTALARAFAKVPADTLCHVDLRDDNVLLGSGGPLACDWTWPALAPAFADTVHILISARADGHDVDTILSRHPLTADAPDDHVDAWLAALCGYLTLARQQPSRASSPHLRAHAELYSRVLWDWLCERRGWSPEL